jgi:sulfur carrier protein
MYIFINSEKKEFAGSHLMDLVSYLQINHTGGLAIAVNEKVITKNDWAVTTLHENDKVILIKATQGG